MTSPFGDAGDARFMARNPLEDADPASLRRLLATRAEFSDLSRLSDAQVRAHVAKFGAEGKLLATPSGVAVIARPNVEPNPNVLPPVPPKPNKPDVKPDKKLTVSFEKQKCRCGDEIKLKATSENIPGGSIKFDLKQKGAAIATASGTLASNAAEVVWKSKAASDTRPEPEIELSGSASGVSAQADKKLLIDKYQDVASETKTIACNSGVFGWTGKFDLALTAGQVVVTVKIKLLNRLGPKPANANDPLPALGAAVSDQDKLAMKTDIEGKLSNKHLFHRKDCKRGDACDCTKTRGCCKIRVQVVVEFVENGAHHDVNLFQGPGRANASNWTRVKTRDNSYAHETGHLLAWYDEYAGGAVGTAPRWKVQQPVVMNTGLTVPAEYYWDFRDWLKAKTNEDWTVLAP